MQKKLEIGGTGKLSDLCHMSQLGEGWGRDLSPDVLAPDATFFSLAPPALPTRVFLTTEWRMDHRGGGRTWEEPGRCSGEGPTGMEDWAAVMRKICR